jgi:hypothetical protein
MTNLLKTGPKSCASHRCRIQGDIDLMNDDGASEQNTIRRGLSQLICS